MNTPEPPPQGQQREQVIKGTSSILKNNTCHGELPYNKPLAHEPNHGSAQD